MNTEDDVPETGGPDDASTRRLYVEFEVEPSSSADCPLSGFERDVVEVRQQRTADRCHTDVTLSPDDCGCADDDCTEVVHAASAVGGRCPCEVFSEYGCVPQITEINGDDVVVETYLPDRDVLTDLVDGLKAVVDGISLRRLKRIGSLEREEPRADVTLNLFELTEKQREAAAAAVAAGYYSRPREADLGELSADLGISKSALSQRLTAVESKLATSAFARATAD
ncbi:helix-turn-helix domain-containing protein [Halorubrum sp. DM2]|uniref:helix-turn-helix domain-containing protein n=1 Tax=Halorubrum sp. DM2 TaxID=2527867 RepID=UPI0024B8466F|nr:helix-turn-helix domain-containing protein [Halorubrum sp. DM2]